MESSSSSSSKNIKSPHHNDFLAAAAAGLTPHHVWTNSPNSSLLSTNVSFASSAASDAAILNLRNPRLHENNNNNNNNLVSSLFNPCSIMSNNIKEFGNLDQWDGGGIHHHQSNGQEELELENIKEESLYPGGGACYSNYAKELREVDELNVKLLLKSLSSCGETSSIINGGGGGGGNNLIEECNSSFSSSSRNKQQSCNSQIYPTINVSELLRGQNHHVSMGDSSDDGFGMNLQALDLFNNSGARFGASFRPPPMFQEQVGFFKNSACFPNFGLDFMHQSALECTLDSGGNVEVHNKRNEKHEETKAKVAGNKTQAGTKRSRLESRSCPPFKVRKEKLGDRIAALQQLVSPYGKTDTASVLMEAIGYINFLQNQVETLSVPYIKSSRHKNNRPPLPHGGYGDNNKSEERKQDLKSRGLCLVPVSCLSYVTDSSGTMWPL